MVLFWFPIDSFYRRAWDYSQAPLCNCDTQIFPFQFGFCRRSVYLTWIPKSKRVRLKVTPSMAEEELELKGRWSLLGSEQPYLLMIKKVHHNFRLKGNRFPPAVQHPWQDSESPHRACVGVFPSKCSSAPFISRDERFSDISNPCQVLWGWWVENAKWFWTEEETYGCFSQSKLLVDPPRTKILI